MTIWLALVLGCEDGGIIGEDCDDVMCEVCNPAIVLHVEDADTGAGIAGVVVEGASNIWCNKIDSAGDSTCYAGADPGHYTLDVSAPGYEPAVVEVDVPESEPGGCCNCGYEWQEATVALVPTAG